MHPRLVPAWQVLTPFCNLLSHPYTYLCAPWCHSYPHNILKCFLYFVLSMHGLCDLQLGSGGLSCCVGVVIAVVLSCLVVC